MVLDRPFVVLRSNSGNERGRRSSVNATFGERKYLDVLLTESRVSSVLPM